MLRMDFHRPLTALEIRDPAIEVCKDVASNFELFVTFHQPQQKAFTGHARQRMSERQRIGNGKHKDWFIDFQEDPPQKSNPKIAGKLAVRSAVRPDKMQFGGFDYGESGEPTPTPVYTYITVHTPSELGHWRPNDPDPELLEMTYACLRAQFEDDYPRLFLVAEYTL